LQTFCQSEKCIGAALSPGAAPLEVTQIRSDLEYALNRATSAARKLREEVGAAPPSARGPVSVFSAVARREITSEEGAAMLDGAPSARASGTGLTWTVGPKCFACSSDDTVEGRRGSASEPIEFRCHKCGSGSSAITPEDFAPIPKASEPGNDSKEG
jgi:hypothetical protein